MTLHLSRILPGGDGARARVAYLPWLDRFGLWIERMKAGIPERSNLELIDEETGETGWKHYEDGMNRPPFLVFDIEDASTLMQGLWNGGARTSEAIESGAHRSAIEGHLADMRQLVATFANVELPGTKRRPEEVQALRADEPRG